jgi:hypothetical protein
MVNLVIGQISLNLSILLDVFNRIFNVTVSKTLSVWARFLSLGVT